MKNVIIVGIILVVIGAGYLLFNRQGPSEEIVLPLITPIAHATFVMEWADIVIYNDPVGDSELFLNFTKPDLIFVSDIHGDHLSVDTLEAVIDQDSIILAPQAAVDNFSEKLRTQTIVINNGETINQKGILIEAIPMYNLPENEDSRHVKGRGNGYVLEKNGIRVYIAGDTAGIPEMRSLENIDMAFVPMNLPYTMDVEEAAKAVLDFKPTQVYPYHYRGQDGLSDVNKFKELVSVDSEIEVVLLEWYPES